MPQVRGIILLIFGVFALFQGWKFHTGQQAHFAYALGVLSIAVGLWRLLRKEPKRLR